MNDLSNYIQKQLKTLLRKVEQTPSKKYNSLSNIRKLVDQVPLGDRQKLSISKSISHIQSTIKLKTTPKKSSQSDRKHSKTQDNAKRNLFFENMLLKEKQLSMNSQPNRQQNGSLSPLFTKFEHLQQYRVEREGYLQQLILKVQRLERLKRLKQQNDQKYLNSKMLEKEFDNKKKCLSNIKVKAIEAAKDNRKGQLSRLVSRFHDNLK